MTELIILYRYNPHTISLIGSKESMILLYNNIVSAKKEQKDMLSIIGENNEMITVTPSEIIHIYLKIGENNEMKK